MARKDIIEMTQKELRKLNVAHKIIDKRISMKDGSEKLALSYRQVKRIVSRIRNQGDLPPKKWTQRRENGRIAIISKEVSDGG